MSIIQWSLDGYTFVMDRMIIPFIVVDGMVNVNDLL